MCIDFKLFHSQTIGDLYPGHEKENLMFWEWLNNRVEKKYCESFFYTLQENNNNINIGNCIGKY